MVQRHLTLPAVAVTIVQSICYAEARPDEAFSCRRRACSPTYPLIGYNLHITMAFQEETLILRNNLAEIQRLTQFIHDFGERHRLPGDLVFNLTLCLEELAVNTITYGYGEGGHHEFSVRMWMEGRAVCVQLEDDAAPFNPLEAPEFDLQRALQQERIGGLGITLVKRLMDVFQYERCDGRNVIRLRKALDPAEAAA